MRNSLIYCTLFAIVCACHAPQKQATEIYSPADSTNYILLAKPDSAGHVTRIETGKTTPAQLLSFATTFIGTPYKFASTNPDEGFDCSGFIAHVFNHFNIAVPRSSVDFTWVNRAIDIQNAKPGDLILFTGTDSTIHDVGHMGIITSNRAGEQPMFIHSTSGKANGVTETPLNEYYIKRYVKTIRIFPQNDK
jgi:cell wall-associated NlpC family hydrolase